VNEPSLEIAALEPPPVPFKDRSTGLVVFGVMTILLGGLAGLFVPLMLFGQAMAAKTTKVPPDFSMILPAVAIYGTMAVGLVWLGIGSIKARRWARALLLIFSWSWLVMGVIAVTVMAFVLPKMLAGIPSNAANGQPAIPPGAMAAVMVVTFVFYGVVFVILPAVWTFFYHSQHVKATCETRDPVTRWTDACPLPVLGLCLWLMFSAPMMLIIPISGHCVMPFFGIFLTGLPGTLYCLAITVIWTYAAWLLYRLDMRGWWLVLVTMCVFMVSGLLTFAHHDMTEMYQLMGYPEAQMELIQQSGLLVGNRMSWLMSLSVLPFLGYLVFIRKFFRPGT
jgi:hypothetical protein